MCGRFAQQRPASELAEIFAAEPLADELGPRYNVAPTDEALVVVQREERRAITAYRWGLVPHWSTDLKAGSRMFNARAETITTSPAFRAAFARRRCLVPVDAFYEWKREGTRPPAVRDRPRRRPAPRPRRAVGGLARPGQRPGGAAHPAHVHDRHDDPERPRWPSSTTGCRSSSPTRPGTRWLDPTPADRGELLALLQPTDEIALRIHAVERLVNDVRNEGPELLAPAGLAARRRPRRGRPRAGSLDPRPGPRTRSRTRRRRVPGVDGGGIAADRRATPVADPSTTRTSASAGRSAAVVAIGRVVGRTTRWALAQAAARPASARTVGLGCATTTTPYSGR